MSDVHTVVKRNPAKVSEYLEQENISPVAELIAIIPDLPPEMQAMLWLNILKHVDPPKPKPVSNIQNNIISEKSDVPLFIRQTHSEEELTEIARSGSGTA